ncbi:MmcQ/YjbR family DNA-binding protein [Pedobacter africanus]|uniref:Predicted DNA-binding protein, MmcQ/YjbR family n=1 Tax=Pedobacter africanus TaxID=151894 RepID=A0A1W2DTY3_9SPHI|nr:MmcQ/YjbR family DNA-binding protein [Pedobacter africanus]SMD00914.1 Predicted DNA-binding protein, MmcQ/YjbR family [Pedobacter africanus]
MDIETFREFCLSLKGTTEGMKWEHLCFMIEDKLFVIASLEDGHLSMKCDPDDFDELVARPGIQQARHMAKRQWVTLTGLDVMPDNELRDRVTISRALVLGKLSKKIQASYT